MTRETCKEILETVKRVVVKVGTRVLVDESGRPNETRLRALVSQLAALNQSKLEVVLVSSGAIGAGMEALGLSSRPKSLRDLQMAAAVGQTRLMSRYSELFAEHDIVIGQVLLTHSDLEHRTRHLNARHTMMNLMNHSIVPIVNENDVVAIEEIKFGDNDHLASLVAMLVDADLLILLTSVNGLQAPGQESGSLERVPYLEDITKETLALTWGKESQLSTGGMASKLQSAGSAVSVGIPVVIADGRDETVLTKVMSGEDCGTFIGRLDKQLSLRGKKRWIAFFNRPEGSLIVDDGACRAVREQGRSLLPIGIRKVEGQFDIGAVVAIKNLTGATIAQGLVDYSSDHIRLIRGHNSEEVTELLGSKHDDEVVHRDNLVLLNR
ncbi:MAG: glutamate 5-kinase [Planctomycetota bacterium]|nr:glutamate 5-kinase [Planctomycetota bacterium]